jgi:hypothetical protein
MREPMQTIRPLASDEHAAWQELVARSPQAGLFQTLAWNQTLCETSGTAERILPLVCEEQGALLAGILLRGTERNGRLRADLPPFGYNGPVLAEGLGYARRFQTLASNRVLERLLAQVRERTECATIHNQPELWDMRAFKFQRWRLETSFTHVLHCGTLSGSRAGLAPELQERIASELEGMSLDLDPAEALVRDFCAWPRLVRRMGGFQEPRIRRLLESGMGRLVAARTRDGQVLALSLLLLSRENRTLYVQRTVLPAEGRNPAALPLLFERASQHLLAGAERIELGSTEEADRSRLLEHLGCELLPRYTARM